MNICFIMYPLEYYSPVSGGALATITYELAKPLIAAGHSVTVLSPSKGDAFYDVGTVVPIAGCRRADVSFIRRAICKLEEKKYRWDIPYYRVYRKSIIKALRGLPAAPDVVVLFNDLASAQFVRRAAPKARIFVDLQNENRTRQRDFAAADRCVEKYIACSQYIKDWTVRQHNIPVERVAVLHSGIDLDAFFPRPDYLEPVAKPRVLFIGRIDPNKGPDISADAVAALRSEGIEIDLTVAGGTWFYGHNPNDPYLLSLIEKVNLAGGKYLGPVGRRDVPALVRDHDIAMVLSRSNEPFGLVVLEAMASGLAVIASSRGGIPEACGTAGRLVNPDDFKAVVDHLRGLVTNPALLAAEKQRSIARAAECTWARRTDELLSIINAATPQGPRT
jgi:glycosyltransferase involved in cell wall biosynthesis